MVDYEALTISDANKALEREVLDRIGHCVSEGKSWAFDAGAGAGKTYALIESIKLILNKKGSEYYRHNQHILCITYTNAAVSEIKDRLRNAPLVHVSTIHERLWEIIAPYHDQLLRQHRRKLRAEIEKCERELQNEPWAKAYQQLREDQKSAFCSYISAEEVRNQFYSAREKNAQELKNALPDIKEAFPSLLTNTGNFKKIVQRIYTIADYSKSLIKTRQRGCPVVKYDPRFNTDRLARMRISHDTLLTYAYNIVRSNDRLKQIVCDQYPVILVDEFQDTDSRVIQLIACVERYARKIGHPFIAGYYGDICQNIYDDGVGAKLFQIHKGLERIQKKFNRRSSPEIIRTANRIRNDGLKQKSIYSSFPEGEVICRIQSAEEHDAVIENICRHWSIDIDNPLHCLELTNERVAAKSGFESIYNFFKQCAYYKRGRNYELLRDHILSQDENKLGDVQKLLFRLLAFRSRVQRDDTVFSELFPVDRLTSELQNILNISNIRNLISKLRGLSGATLDTYVDQIFEKYEKGDLLYDRCIHNVTAEEITSLAALKGYMQERLFPINEETPPSEEDRQENMRRIEEFLSIDMETFSRWYGYVSGQKARGNVVYHTFHGTKGCEYDNVLIFMTGRFGRNKPRFFTDLFRALAVGAPSSADSPDVRAARNLFYVTVTRAVRNLCVVYLLDSNEDADAAKAALTQVFDLVRFELL